MCNQDTRGAVHSVALNEGLRAVALAQSLVLQLEAEEAAIVLFGEASRWNSQMNPKLSNGLRTRLNTSQNVARHFL